MNEFKKKLTALRNGASKVAKGTLSNMKRGLDGSASKDMKAYRDKRDANMIEENFGNEENYRKASGIDTPEGKDLFTPTYQKAGKVIGKGMKGLADRLVQMRGGR